MLIPTFFMYKMLKFWSILTSHWVQTSIMVINCTSWDAYTSHCIAYTYGSVHNQSIDPTQILSLYQYHRVLILFHTNTFRFLKRAIPVEINSDQYPVMNTTPSYPDTIQHTNYQIQILSYLILSHNNTIYVDCPDNIYNKTSQILRWYHWY